METLLKCRKFDVLAHEVDGADGRRWRQEFIRHPGAVVILPLIDEATCLMLRQFRPTLGRELWELPAGTLDLPGEEPVSAAGRELEEETGHQAARIEPLCSFYPTPGISTERIWSFVARELTPTRQRLEPTERISVESVPLDRAMSMIQDGTLIDAKSMITLMWQTRAGSPVR